ncbi:hypothetical protein BJ878DRAFT_478788 [Calycina marina]|uniref:Uncharacterized protein n=1 Tax=Calycina marina TaxID=1763456 RepID=A0A9P7Z6B6_9HELO|nr:hypothetical protein BJ878DRAFT_478788 [Calycina marina]
MNLVSDLSDEKRVFSGPPWKVMEGGVQLSDRQRRPGISATGGRYHATLQVVAFIYSVSIKDLLDNGAGVNDTGGELGSVLQAASASCSADAVQLLPGFSAETNLICSKHGTALRAVLNANFRDQNLGNRHYRCVRLLLHKTESEKGPTTQKTKITQYENRYTSSMAHFMIPICADVNGYCDMETSLEIGTKRTRLGLGRQLLPYRRSKVGSKEEGTNCIVDLLRKKWIEGGGRYI